MNEEQEIIYNELLSKYNFDECQKSTIEIGLENNIDVNPYLNPNLCWEEMRIIWLKLESKK